MGILAGMKKSGPIHRGLFLFTSMNQGSWHALQKTFFLQIEELNYRLNLTLPGLCPAAVASPIRIETVLGKFLKTLPTDYPIWGGAGRG
jgi:hypothetical protein